MPRYTITDQSSGRTLTIEGDSPPTEEEILQLFESTRPLAPQADREAFAREQADLMQRQIVESAGKAPAMRSAAIRRHVKALQGFDLFDEEPGASLRYKPGYIAEAERYQADLEAVAKQQAEDEAIAKRLTESAMKATPGPDAARQFEQLASRTYEEPLPTPGTGEQLAQGLGTGMHNVGRGFRNAVVAPAMGGVAGAQEFIKQWDRPDANLGDIINATRQASVGMGLTQLGVSDDTIRTLGGAPEPTADDTTPFDEGTKRLGNWGVPSRALSMGLETAPHLASVIGLQAAGIPAPVTAPLIFGSTPEGFSPRGAAVAAAIPYGGRLSGIASARGAAALGVRDIPTRNIIGKIGSMVGPAATLYAGDEMRIQEMPVEERAEARREAIGSALSLALLGPPGYRGERLPPKNILEIVARQRAVRTEIERLESTPDHLDTEAQRRLDALRMEEETQLTPEYQAVLEEAAMNSGIELEYGDPIIKEAPGEGDPFSQRRAEDDPSKYVFQANRATGKVRVIAKNLKEFLEDDLSHMTPDEKAAEIALQLFHEKIHLVADPGLGKTYWKNLSAAEKKIIERIYYGPEGRPKGHSDALVGDEVIRFRLEKLSRLTPTELRTIIGKEGWTVKGLSMLETAIRGIRVAFNIGGARKLSRYDKVLLRRLENNIAYAKRIAAGGKGRVEDDEQEAPASRRRGREPGPQDEFEALRAAADSEAYDALVKKLKAAPTWEEKMQVQQQIEDLKNQYEGFPPSEIQRPKNKDEAIANLRNAYEEAKNEVEDIEYGGFLKSLSEEKLGQMDEALEMAHNGESSIRDTLSDNGWLANEIEAVQRLYEAQKKVANIEEELAYMDDDEVNRTIFEGPDAPASRRRGPTKYQEQQAARLAELRWRAQQEAKGEPVPERQPPQIPTEAFERSIPEQHATKRMHPVDIGRRTLGLTPEEREQMGLPPATAAASKRVPSFEQFMEDVAEGYPGREQNPDQFVDAWAEARTKWLESANKDQLLELAGKLRLQNELIPAALRKRGYKLTAVESHTKDVKGAEVLRAKQLARAERMEKLADETEKKADSLEKIGFEPIRAKQSALLQRKLTEEELRSKDKPKILRETQLEMVPQGTPTGKPAKEKRILELRHRATVLRREAARISSEARRDPTDVAVGRKGKEVQAVQAVPAKEQTELFPLTDISARARIEETPSQQLRPDMGPRLKGEGAGPQAALINLKRAIYNALEPMDAKGQDLNRKDVSLDDIDWGKGMDAVREVASADLDAPSVLANILTKGGGSDRTTKYVAGPGKLARRVAPNISHTKSLIAMLDKSTKRVHLLSAYRDGRRGVVVFDPALVGGRQTEFNQMLRRYVPLGSVLLNSPVKNFHKSFETVDDFNKQFWNDVKRNADQMARGVEAAEAQAEAPRSWQREEWSERYGEVLSGDPTDIVTMSTSDRPTQVTKGAGGSVVGQFAQDLRNALDISEGALESGRGLTEPEARAAYRAFRYIETDADAYHLIDDLVKRSKHDVNVRRTQVDIAELRDKVATAIKNIAKKTGDERWDIRDIVDSEMQFKEKGDALAELFDKETNKDTQKKIRKIVEHLYDISKLEPLLEGGMSASDHLLRNAVRKVAQELARNNSELKPADQLTDGQIKLKAINTLYEIAQRNPTESAAIGLSTRTFSKEPPLPPERGPQRSKTARELSTKVRRLPIEQSDLSKREIIRPESLSPIERAALRNKLRSEETRGGFLSPLEKAALTKKLKREYAKEHGIEEMTLKDWEEVNKPIQERQGDAPASRRRAVQRFVRNVAPRDKFVDFVRGFGSPYDEWMIPRIQRKGGPMAEAVGDLFSDIIDRKKAIYGELTPVLDEARQAAGGTKWVKGIGQVPNTGRIKAMSWINDFYDHPTPHTAMSNVIPLMEGAPAVNIPAHLQADVDAIMEPSRRANLATGRLYQGLARRFRASGKFQRLLTGYGIDLIRQNWRYNKKTGDWDPSVELRRWAQGLAHVNSKPVGLVLSYFKKLKGILDDPLTTAEKMDLVNQDMARKFPQTITHVQSRLGTWNQIIHSDLFGYLENTAQRASHIRAMREKFPNTKPGRKAFRDSIEKVREELDPSGNDTLDALLRTMQGHPTDSPGSRYGVLSPASPVGEAFRMANQTVGNLIAKAVLTGQMFTQTGELLAGSTPQMFGIKNYLRGMARHRQIYAEMEKAGEVNRVMYDFSWDPHSPVRSVFKQAGGAISKLSAQQFLNEMQEAVAASTARVVSERIVNNELTGWEKRNLPATFKEMGFTQTEVGLLMSGDKATLDKFQRRAASFLTGGNKVLAEGSKLGGNRLFNSLFRFQLYPMTRTNQFRQVFGNLVDTWTRPSGKEKWVAAERMARFFGYGALQGALTAGITTLAFQNLFGLGIKANEAKDEKYKFAVESFLASMSGPLYLAWRGSRDRGVAGIGDQVARTLWPYSIMRDFMDAGNGLGPYRDRSAWDRIGIMLRNKTPGMKAIGTGLAVFGLANTNHRDISNAITAKNRWKASKWEGAGGYSRPTEEEMITFKQHFVRALDAMKAGDEQKFFESLDAAFEATPEMKKDSKLWQDTMNKKLELVNHKGQPLTDEEMQELRNRIGDDAVEKLMFYDDMVRHAARGRFLTPDQ